MSQEIQRWRIVDSLLSCQQTRRSVIPCSWTLLVSWKVGHSHVSITRIRNEFTLSFWDSRRDHGQKHSLEMAGRFHSNFPERFLVPLRWCVWGRMRKLTTAKARNYKLLVYEPRDPTMKDCWFTSLLPTNQEKCYSLFLDVAGLVESWPFTREHHSYPTRKDEEPKNIMIHLQKRAT